MASQWQVGSRSGSNGRGRANQCHGRCHDDNYPIGMNPIMSTATIEDSKIPRRGRFLELASLHAGTAWTERIMRHAIARLFFRHGDRGRGTVRSGKRPSSLVMRRAIAGTLRKARSRGDHDHNADCLARGAARATQGAITRRSWPSRPGSAAHTMRHAIAGTQVMGAIAGA